MPFIVDRTMRKSLIDALLGFEKEIYFSAPLETVYKPVNTHPDIQIHFASQSEAFVPPELYDYYRAVLPSRIRLRKGNKSLGGTYPYDVAYNVSRIGKNIILNSKYADEKIVGYYKRRGFNFVNVKQGYAKCNICSDGNIAVTEDCGIYKALLKSGIKTLKIPVGSVRLCGFQNGFIGGACGSYKNKILFCGEMKNDALAAFLKESKLKPISLDRGKLTDYGSILYFE